jgi:hypothetical protein
MLTFSYTVLENSSEYPYLLKAITLFLGNFASGNVELYSGLITQAPRYEVMRGTGGITILFFGTRCRPVVGFTLLPL